MDSLFLMLRKGREELQAKQQQIKAAMVASADPKLK
jgi:hypothetical protein